MSALDEFHELLKKNAKDQVPIQTEWCTVKDVDWDDKTMTVTSQVNGLDYFDVLLGLGHLYKKPKTGAKCLIGLIANTDACFLIDCEAVEAVEFITKDTKLIIKEEGVVIKREDESVISCLNDLIDELNKIIVVNGTSVNVAAVTAIKQRLNTVLI